MRIFGRLLQLFGLVDCAYALLVGIVDNDMGRELTFAAFGICVFAIGRVIESRFSK